MSKKIIKKILNSAGYDITRFQNRQTDLSWLKNKNITTVFDIGANVGQFAEEIRSELPDAQIYSFEPVKETYDALVNNFASDKKFRAFNMGLGSKKEKKEIKISAYSLSSSFLPQSKTLETVFPHTKEVGTQTVNAARSTATIRWRVTYFLPGILVSSRQHLLDLPRLCSRERAANQRGQ